MAEIVISRLRKYKTPEDFDKNIKTTLTAKDLQRLTELTQEYFDNEITGRFMDETGQELVITVIQYFK